MSIESRQPDEKMIDRAADAVFDVAPEATLQELALITARIFGALWLSVVRDNGWKPEHADTQIEAACKYAAQEAKRIAREHHRNTMN